jgi:GYF domain 2/Domain of unknown function (DUF4190)
MSVGSGGWYVRGRGRVLGPFNWSQLQTLRDRGQLSQLHELSQDRRSWIKATDLPGLYTPAGVGPSQPSTTADVEWPTSTVADGAGAQATGAAPSEWFIARGDTHQGPLSLADLHRMMDTVVLGPSSLVWTNGMANWEPAGQVPELRSAASAGTGAGSFAGSPSQVHQPSRTNGLAVASLVLGLLWLCGIGSLLATIFGAVALSQISRSSGTITGKNLAIAGLILGALGLLLLTLGVLGIFLGSIPRSRWGL